jgi:hypothetical protein
MEKTIRFLAVCLVAFCLLGGVHVQPVRADAIAPDVPSGPTMPPELHRPARPTVPLYSVGAGVVAVTLTGSLVAMRVIRKRNEK